MPRWGWNPQSQQASDRTPTSWTARPLGAAERHYKRRSKRVYYREHCISATADLEGNKMVSCFSQTQQYILLYFSFDDIFRSIDHHQVILQNLE
jgi:hypothetical protein